MENKNFVALILTHGRPNNQVTVNTLKRHGYTGDWKLVVDDEDITLPEYRRVWGDDKVVTFSKNEIAERFDEVDNSGERRTIFYARNASFDIAEKLGYKYFIQLDDDYDSFRWRMNEEIEYSSLMLSPLPEEQTLDKVFDIMLEYFISVPLMYSLCMAQSGDYIGGGGSKMVSDQFRRKVMNSFICSTDRRFNFVGRINEDVNTYTSLAHQGFLFLTTAFIALNQKTTQTNTGGMSEMYKSLGTYTKTAYTIITHPSGAKFSVLYNTSAIKGAGKEKDNNAFRIHHRINWRNTAPLILREEHKKV